MRNIVGRFSYHICTRKNTVIDCLLILFLAITPLWRMEMQGMWELSDTGFDIIPGFYIRLVLSGRGAIGFPALPIALIWKTLSCLGFSLEIVQRIYLFSLFAFMGWGMYYLTCTIFKHRTREEERIAGIVAATYFMYNSYVIQRISLGAETILLGLAVLPFLLAFLFKAIRTERGWPKYSILTSFCFTFLFVSGFEITLLTIIFVSMYLSYEILTSSVISGRESFHVVKRILITVIISVLSNLWFVLPTLCLYLFTNFVQEGYLSARVTEAAYAASSWPQLLLKNVLRLQMYPTIYPMYPEWWASAVFLQLR